jgi:hypothetical protein
MPKKISPPPEIIQQHVLKILREHRGEDRRIGRAELNRELDTWVGQHIDDREMREAIEHLRSSHPEGCMIATSREKGSGYYIAESLTDLDKALTSDENRLISIAQRIRQQRRAAGIGLRQLGLGLDVPARREWD